MEDIVLIGYGGHAKSVADCIERMGKYNIVGYTDLNKYDCKYEYLGTDDALESLYQKGIKNCAVCIGYLGKGRIREALYSKLKTIGFSLPVIADPSAVISTDSVIEEGTFIGKLAVINNSASIGKMCIINTKAVVEHDCKVADFVHVAVNAVLCGEVTIGRAAFIGANATVIQCRSISENEIVPAGKVIR